MTTRRQLKNEVDNLTDDDDTGDPLVMNITSITDESGRRLSREESPHPELTVESWPDSDGHDTLKIAIPNVWPNGLPDCTMLTVYSCKSITNTWPTNLEDSDNAVLACDLWEELSESDLQTEYDTRKERGEPIPPILDDYETQ